MEFKVGDIVRFTNINGETYHEGVGTHSIITDFTNHGWPINAVDIDGPTPGIEVAYDSSEIELVYRETHSLKDKLRELIEELRLSDWMVDSTIDYDTGHRRATNAAIEGIENILKEFGNG